MKQVKLAAEPSPLTSYELGVWYVWPDGARARIMHGPLNAWVKAVKVGPFWTAGLMYPPGSWSFVDHARTKNAAMLAVEKWLYQQARETLKFLRQRD